MEFRSVRRPATHHRDIVERRAMGAARKTQKYISLYFHNSSTLKRPEDIFYTHTLPTR